MRCVNFTIFNLKNKGRNASIRFHNQGGKLQFRTSNQENIFQHFTCFLNPDFYMFFKNPENCCLTFVFYTVNSCLLHFHELCLIFVIDNYVQVSRTTGPSLGSRTSKYRPPHTSQRKVHVGAEELFESKRSRLSLPQ
jgi:hypothetical protein